jgi:hypothetical protein
LRWENLSTELPGNLGERTGMILYWISPAVLSTLDTDLHNRKITCITSIQTIVISWKGKKYTLTSDILKISIL